MPPALVLTSASKANLAGGAFADSLTANSGDTLNVITYPLSSPDVADAWLYQLWAGDSDSVMEGEIFYTRPDSTHDQINGYRFQVPAITPGGAGNTASFDIIRGGVKIPVFPNDSATIKVTGTAADDALVSYLILYNNAPGLGPAQFMSWNQVQNLRKSNVGINWGPTASGTPGAYGTNRALNADDNRFHANAWYAILGVGVQTQVSTIGLLGPPWGGQRIGLPVGALFLNSNMWFVEQSIALNNLPIIPYFHQADSGNILGQVADLEASTQPKADWNLVELSAAPVPGQ